MATPNEITRLENLLSQALNVKQCKVVRVWKGFLVTCKIPNQQNVEEPFVVWIHEQNLEGILSKSGVIDKSIDLIAFGAWFINPLAGLLAGTGRLLVKRIGFPPRQNQIFSSRTHVVEYGTYYLTRNGRVLKSWDLLKRKVSDFIKIPGRIEQVISSLFSTDGKDPINTKQKTSESVSSARVLVPPGDILSYTFIRFNSRLDFTRRLELEGKEDGGFSKLKGTIEMVSVPSPAVFKVFDQDEAFNFLSRLKRYGFEIQYVPE
ncbi:MAG: hypothetical protein ACFFBD_30400 [Candidatus Hodarchaeota archaeon]